MNKQHRNARLFYAFQCAGVLEVISCSVLVDGVDRVQKRLRGDFHLLELIFELVPCTCIAAVGNNEFYVPAQIACCAHHHDGCRTH